MRPPQTASRLAAARRGWVALLIVASSGATVLAATVRAGARESRATRHALATTIGTRVAGPDVRVREADGRPRPLVERDGVILVVASTCPHCHRTLAALAALGGAPAGTTVVSLDGAARGARLLASLGVRATVVEPVDAARFVRALPVPGTPLLLRVTRDGVVRAALLGEPSADELRAWRGRD